MQCDIVCIVCSVKSYSEVKIGLEILQKRTETREKSFGKKFISSRDGAEKCVQTRRG